MALSLWTAKANVLAALTTALLPDNADIVQLGYAVENPSSQQRRRVFILGVPIDQPQPPFSPGSQVRAENYDIPILVEFEVLAPTGQSPSVGFAAAQAGLATLVGLIEQQNDTDPSWGGIATASGIQLAPPGEQTGPLADQAGGFLSRCMLQVHIRTFGN